MTVTVLAILFILLVLALALFGFNAIIRQGKAPEEINKERCSLCRRVFDKSQMIERQVGDYKLMFFCASCIQELHGELERKG